MEKNEIVVLGFILFGLLAFALGLIFFVMKIMEKYAVNWELQLAFIGLLLVMLGLILSKILSKVNG